MPRHFPGRDLFDGDGGFRRNLRTLQQQRDVLLGLADGVRECTLGALEFDGSGDGFLAHTPLLQYAL